jgi:hypothetical protein
MKTIESGARPKSSCSDGEKSSGYATPGMAVSEVLVGVSVSVVDPPPLSDPHAAAPTDATVAMRAPTIRPEPATRAP